MLRRSVRQYCTAIEEQGRDEVLHLFLRGSRHQYLKRNSRNGYFAECLTRLKAAGHHWKNYAEHLPILSELEDVGGLEHCDDEETAKRILKWMVLCYVGEPGGYGRGYARPVFFSDDGAPIISRIIKRSTQRELSLLKSLNSSTSVKSSLARGQAIAKRYEDLLDIAGDE